MVNGHLRTNQSITARRTDSNMTIMSMAIGSVYAGKHHANFCEIMLSFIFCKTKQNIFTQFTCLTTPKIGVSYFYNNHFKIKNVIHIFIRFANLHNIYGISTVYSEGFFLYICNRGVTSIQ